jgi:hypothetical protein
LATNYVLLSREKLNNGGSFMGSYATKSFFEKKLKEYSESGDKYFEVAPAVDCCPICEAMANKKILIATATKDDFPPFHIAS